MMTVTVDAIDPAVVRAVARQIGAFLRQRDGTTVFLLAAVREARPLLDGA